MANGLLGYQQQSQLAESLQRVGQQKEQEFMGNMLRDQLEGAGDIYMEGGTPQYEPGILDFRSKDAALNAYIQHRKGKISDMEILSFNEKWKQMQGLKNQKEIDNLNRLSMMGLDKADTDEFLRNNPKLYGSVVERILALESMGDEGKAEAALLRSKYVPTKGWGEWAEDMAEDYPVGTLLGGATAIGLGSAAWTQYAPRFIEAYGTDPKALKVLKDFSDGTKYVKEGDKWYHTKKETHTVKKGKNKGKVTVKYLKGVKGKAVNLPRAIKMLNDAEKATTPTGRMALKNFFGKTPAALKGIAPYFGGTIGRGVGSIVGAEDEGEMVGRATGAGIVGTRGAKSLMDIIGKGAGRFMSGAAARHAAANIGAGGGPVGWTAGQLIATLVNLGFAAWEIKNIISEISSGE